MHPTLAPSHAHPCTLCDLKGTPSPRQNLENDISYTNRRSLVTFAVTSLLIGASVGIQILLKYVQAQISPDTDTTLTANETAIYSLLLSAIASTVVVVVNLLLKWTIKHFVSLEGHDTKTDFEIRVFTMLSMAYLLNTVVMPMALGAMPFGVRYLTVLDAYKKRGGCLREAKSSLVHRF